MLTFVSLKMIAEKVDVSLELDDRMHVQSEVFKDKL
jgi:hypothetical protein